MAVDVTRGVFEFRWPEDLGYPHHNMDENRPALKFNRTRTAGDREITEG
jgi:hypothetical protein